MLRIVIDSGGGPETRACHAINARPRLTRTPGCRHLGNDLARQEMERSIDPRCETFRATQWPPGSPLCLELASRNPSWQRPYAVASTDRTYERKRSDRNIIPTPCKQGAVHIWVASSGFVQPTGCSRLLAMTNRRAFRSFGSGSKQNISSVSSPRLPYIQKPPIRLWI
jgi:hypothetical protein